MSWKDPQAPACNNCSVVAFLEERGIASAGVGSNNPFQTPMFTAVGANPSKFHFIGTINASTTSISNLQFSFEVDEKDGSSPTIFNKGSIIDQDVLFLDRDRTIQNEIVFIDEGRIQETVVIAVGLFSGVEHIFELFSRFAKRVPFRIFPSRRLLLGNKLRSFLLRPRWACSLILLYRRRRIILSIPSFFPNKGLCLMMRRSWMGLLWLEMLEAVHIVLSTSIL